MTTKFKIGDLVRSKMSVFTGEIREIISLSNDHLEFKGHYGYFSANDYELMPEQKPPAPSEKLARDMTLREWYAGMAMMGLLCNRADHLWFAKFAVGKADAVIEELNKEK